MGIVLHRLDVDLDADGICEGWEALAPDERARAQRFAQRADRARCAQTRIAVRRLLAARLGCQPADVSLGSGPHGKPCVLGGAGAQPLFNVSHAGAHAFIALADPSCVTHLGVDIEQYKRHLDVAAILPVAFTERECHEMRTAADIPGDFYARWVSKEAVLKAIGVGVTEHLQSVGIHLDGQGGLDVVCSIPAWQGFQAMALCAPPGYAAALAWHTKETM